MMIKNGLTNLFIFTTGAALGSLVTWKLVKSKYEQIAQEEIDSVKEVFFRRENDTTEVEEPDSYESVEEEKVPTVKDFYENVVEGLGYFNYSGIERKQPEEEKPAPYVIAPEEYGEIEGYDKITLYCFACGTLTDDQNEPVDDVENTVGKDSLTHFGEYEDDAVHVRNDELKTDYEILLDQRRYSDIGTVIPYLEDE